VEKTQLDPIAAHLLNCYLDTAVYSRQFLEEHESPPTLMAKVHYLLSAMQAAVARDVHYELLAEYAEYGRVHIKVHKTGNKLLLRSSATLAIEKAKRFEQLTLVEVPAVALDPSRVKLLVYGFIPAGLNLSVADTARPSKGKRLIARGLPEFVGFWPFSSPEDPRPSFDQSGPDPFGDVGDLGHDEEGEEGEEGATA